MYVNQIVFVFLIFVFCSFFLTSPLTMLGGWQCRRPPREGGYWPPLKSPHELFGGETSWIWKLKTVLNRTLAVEKKTISTHSSSSGITTICFWKCVCCVVYVRRAINATMTNIAICYKWLVLVLNINSSGQNSSKKRSVLKHYTTEPRVECFQQNNQNSASESRPSFSFQISPKLLATKSGPNFSLNILTKLQFQNLEQSSNLRRQNLNQTVAHAFLIINISISNNINTFRVGMPG